ncbi:MAG: hypothetical protein LBC71_03380, partial [Oscillospiraceae bacterium]|nr:hypothetical protein [Oscillospiraceae bacterium]
MNRMKKSIISLLLTIIILFCFLMPITNKALADSDDAEFFDYVDFVMLIEKMISEGNTPEQAIEILIEEAVKSTFKYTIDITGRLVIDTLKNNYEQNNFLNEMLDKINMKSTITVIDYGITAYGYVGSMTEYYEYIRDSDNPYVTSNIQFEVLFETLNLLSTTLKTFLPGIGNLISIPLDLGKNTTVMAQNMLSAFEGRNARLFLEFVGLASNSVLIEFARYINVEGILEQLIEQKESLENAKTLYTLLGSHIALNEVLYPDHIATKETIDSELLELKTLIADIENYLSYFYEHAEAAIARDEYKSRMHNKGDIWWNAWKFHAYNDDDECVYERKPTIVNLINYKPEYKTCTELAYDSMFFCMCLEKVVKKLDVNYIGNTTFFRHVNNAGNKIVNEAPRIISPLAINLFGDEVETLPIDYGIRFDHEGFGNRIATGWVAPNTALLAIDLNGNGMIDSGLELFGNNTRLRMPTAAHGFEALARWDSNGDGIIDEQDPIFDSLLLWFDLNSNGISEPNELIPLRDMGIASINLNYVETDRVDVYGNEFRQVSTVTMTNEIEVEIVDIWFVTDSSDFELANQVSISERVSALPQIRGFNTVHNLHQAMMLDSSGQLIELVEQFMLEKDEAVQRQLARQIVFRWTKTTTVINALGALTGEYYTGQTGTNVMAFINQTFDDLLNTLYEVLMSQSHLSHLYDTVAIVGGTRELPIIDLMPVVDIILETTINEQVEDVALLNNFIRNLEALSLMSSSNISDFLETLVNNDARITTINVSGMIFGTSGNDVITIPNSRGHMVFGLGGNDTIRATGNGTNTIDPGTGNNTIVGGTGIDTYIIGRGYGINHITANSNSVNTTRDKLIFKDGISPVEVFLLRVGDNLEIFIMSADNISNRTINEIEALDIVTNKTVFVDFFKENRRRVTDISFNDGTNWIISNPLIQSFSVDIDIFTIDDLMNIRTNQHINYRLMSDLDLDGVIWQPIGTNINPFMGNFDGNGFTISNLNVNLSNQDNVGLFGVNSGMIKNLTLDGVNVIGRDNVGSVSGRNTNALLDVTVKNVTELRGRAQTGGLVGDNTSTITNSKLEGAILIAGTGSNTGGLAGRNNGGVIQN